MVGPVEPAVLAAPQLVDQRPGRVPPDQGVALVEDVTDHGRDVVQVHRHAGPLRALTGVHEHRLGSAIRVHDAEVGAVRRLLDRAQRRRQLLRSRRHGGEPVPLVRPPGRGRGDEIAEVGEPVGSGGHPLAHPGDLVGQARPVEGRGEKHVGAGRAAGRGWGGGGLEAFGDHMDVRAAEPGGAHPDPDRPTGVREADRADRNRHRAAVPGDRRGEPTGIGLSGHLPRGGDPEALEQTGDSGRAVGVPEHRLVGAHVERRPARVPVPPVDLIQRHQLDLVAERSPGPVGLHVVEVRRVDPRAAEGGAQQIDLGDAVGCRDAEAAAVVVDRRGADHPVDPVPVGQGVGQAFEDEDAAAVTAEDAVGVGRERTAPPGRRNRADPAHEDAQLGRDQQADPAGEGDVALAGPQALARQMHGEQGGGAGGGEGDGAARS